MFKIFFISILILFNLTTITKAKVYKPPLSQFSKNVLTHVVLHEFGHAFIREFKIPVLGNEENIADSFATNFISQNLRDDAVEIITARAKSWIVEDSEVNSKDYDHKGEHELDIRRAYRAMCLLYGADPADWADMINWVEFSEGDLSGCSDAAPDQIDGWHKTLSAIKISNAKPSDKIEIIYGEGPYKLAVQKAQVFEKIAKLMRQYKWPNKITLHFDHCDVGARWSRSERKILVCDNYLARFIEQEKHIK